MFQLGWAGPSTACRLSLHSLMLAERAVRAVSLLGSSTVNTARTARTARTLCDKNEQTEDSPAAQCEVQGDPEGQQGQGAQEEGAQAELDEAPPDRGPRGLATTLSSDQQHLQISPAASQQ